MTTPAARWCNSSDARPVTTLDGEPDARREQRWQAERSRTWSDCQGELAGLAQRQLFFVGGAPRSGTTWLQQMLDCHPDVSCRGEGLFWKHLAVPLEAMLAQQYQALKDKNARLFRHTGGYPLPAPDEVDHLLATAILLALRRQVADRPCRAVGEKTPENLFLFSRLRRLFPRARFIAIARDPRDVLTSAWHMFHTPLPSADRVAAMTAFIRGALPSLADGARAVIAFGESHPDALMTVTYEALRGEPAPILARLFRFLGVSDRAEVVADCLARTSFATLTRGRTTGGEEGGSFLRKAVVGDWRSTLTPEMNEIVLQELGWTFPHFGWNA
jgi:hypothetical protein